MRLLHRKIVSQDQARQERRQELPGEPSLDDLALEHFQEKWNPVFRPKMRQRKMLERFLSPVANSASLPGFIRLHPAIHRLVKNCLRAKTMDPRLKNPRVTAVVGVGTKLIQPTVIPRELTFGRHRGLLPHVGHEAFVEIFIDLGEPSPYVEFSVVRFKKYGTADSSEGLKSTQAVRQIL
jgi:hypothetical protein